MRIPEDVIEKIKQENDIIDIISESVKLKRTGRNYIGLCPFHNDKSPSFSVSQDKQIYKCFSCGEAGNVITFVMKNKNLNFIEALKLLADKANIPLSTGDENTSEIEKKKNQLFELNAEAGRYLFKNLVNNEMARDYLTQRGITNQTIKRFGLGFAKDGWQNIRNYMKSKGYTEEQLLEVGLIIKSEKSKTLYDRFRNRLMFPVFDIKGRVIGFGGRVFDDSKPKYLNSPETILFKKGVNLYGLNFAIKNKIQDRYFIIVEGYMDCISLHQYGITNVVASLGTALTVNQARLLKRYADKVIISYDADFAGQTATIRGLEILKEAGFEVRVLQIPDGKDPDEFVRMHGKEAFLNLVDSALTLIEYQIKMAQKGVNFNDKQSLVKYGEKVTNILYNVNPVEKDIYIKQISEDTGIKEQNLYDLLNMEYRRKDEKNMNKKQSLGAKLYVEPTYIKDEESLLKLMLQEAYYSHIIKNVLEDDFILSCHRKIFNLIRECKDNKIDNINLYIESRCDDPESSKEWIKIQEIHILEADDKEKLLNDYITKIKSYKIKLKLDSLKKEQKELERKGMIEESIKLAIELKTLNEELKNIKKSGSANGRWE